MEMLDSEYFVVGITGPDGVYEKRIFDSVVCCIFTRPPPRATIHTF